MLDQHNVQDETASLTKPASIHSFRASSVSQLTVWSWSGRLDLAGQARQCMPKVYDIVRGNIWGR